MESVASSDLFLIREAEMPRLFSLPKRMLCPAEPTPKSVVRKESKAAGQVVDQPYDNDSRTITVTPGQAFPGDNRSSSGGGLGDGLVSHTAKWLQARCRLEHFQAI